MLCLCVYAATVCAVTSVWTTVRRGGGRGRWGRSEGGDGVGATSKLRLARSVPDGCQLNSILLRAYTPFAGFCPRPPTLGTSTVDRVLSLHPIKINGVKIHLSLFPFVSCQSHVTA